ncbi:hypothetical protein ES705_33932 [subsurface metagenome]
MVPEAVTIPIPWSIETVSASLTSQLRVVEFPKSTIVGLALKVFIMGNTGFVLHPERRNINIRTAKDILLKFKIILFIFFSP